MAERVCVFNKKSTDKKRKRERITIGDGTRLSPRDSVCGALLWFSCIQYYYFLGDDNPP